MSRPLDRLFLLALVLASVFAVATAEANTAAVSRVVMSIEAPRSAVAGTIMTVTGRTTASRATTVTVQRARGKAWQKIATGKFRRRKFSVRVTLGPSVRVGTLRLRVIARRGSRTLAASRTLAVKVRAPQVPGAAASQPVDDRGGRGSVGGDYPDADAVDCSAPPPRGFGIYSWCKNGTWLSPRGFGYRNCTDYAAWVLGLTRANFRFPNAQVGNAKDWKAYAPNAGLTVHDSSHPTVGDIAWWGGGGFGHVAVVTAVYPSGSVDTVDYNGDAHGNKTTRSQTRAEAYLHPATPPTIVVDPPPSSVDTDGDGVLDRDDRCPSLAGPAFNHGCPVRFEPLTGDFNGDGKTDLAVRDINTGVFYMRPGPDHATETSFAWQPGAGYQPYAGDFNGDGKTDIGLRDISSGVFYTRLGPDYGTEQTYAWTAGAYLQPLTGDFNGDGKTDLAVRDINTGVFYMRPATITTTYGNEQTYAWTAG
jgi:hypothetical protein